MKLRVESEDGVTIEGEHQYVIKALKKIYCCKDEEVCKEPTKQGPYKKGRKKGVRFKWADEAPPKPKRGPGRPPKSVEDISKSKLRKYKRISDLLDQGVPATKAYRGGFRIKYNPGGKEIRKFKEWKQRN